MKSIVYIVHCIDTEGPLDEKLDAFFERIEESFSLKIKPTKKNLNLILEKKLNLNGLEDDVIKVFNSKETGFLKNWTELDKELKIITSKKFRSNFLDSFGNPCIYNWFVLQHYGFIGKNPRSRDVGFSNIYDKYHKLVNSNNSCINDRIYFHYHAPPISGDYHRAGSSFLNSSHLYDVLSRLLIERNWFPSAFRAGHITERPDLNFFLEQWIPFDFSNGSNSNDQYFHQDASRFGDWRHASKSWQPYHPSLNNYQKKGNLNRWIARCLSMGSRDHQISKTDIDKAFKEAINFNSSILSFFNHDFRNMRDDIIRTYSLINEVSKKFPKVKFKFVNAVNAFRHKLKTNSKNKIGLNYKLIKTDRFVKIIIKTNTRIFGPQPFFSIKLNDGRYFWQNLDFDSHNQWSYKFDYDNILFNKISKIGIAVTNKQGIVETSVYDLKSKTTKNKIYND